MKASTNIEFEDIKLTPEMHRVAGPWAITVLDCRTGFLLAFLLRRPEQVVAPLVLASVMEIGLVTEETKQVLESNVHKLSSVLSSLGVRRAVILALPSFGYVLQRSGTDPVSPIVPRVPTPPTPFDSAFACAADTTLANGRVAT